jgi:hypothetical protein
MMAYKIRERRRVCASPKDGMSSEWTEYQVVDGHRIVSRHDIKEQALNALEFLSEAQRLISGRCDDDTTREWWPFDWYGSN